MPLPSHLSLPDPRALQQKLASLAAILDGDQSLGGPGAELKNALERQLAGCSEGISNDQLAAAHAGYDAVYAELMVRSG